MQQRDSTLTSNLGHLLWSGIVDADKAAACARHLVGPRLFSGWGVRTMALGEGAYNPIGYHLGTVWPFDNSFVAQGLRNDGFTKEAAIVALGNLEAARFFDYRLPEAFAGYAREETNFPVEYPTACSPQAWSAGAPSCFCDRCLASSRSAISCRSIPPCHSRSNGSSCWGILGRWGRADACARGLMDASPETKGREKTGGQHPASS